MTEIKLSLDTLNAVMAYLGTQPYQSVANLIAAVQREAAGQVPEVEPTPEATP